MALARRTRARRSGFTLLELLAVVAILVILGAIVAPSFRAMSGDSKVKAGADAVRARIAEAKAAAMADGRAYRVAISADGKRLRVSPEESAVVAQALAEDDDQGPTIVEEDMPDGVTAVPVFDDEAQGAADEAGWVRLLTFLPNGECREDRATVEIREPGVYALVITVRGLTGASSVSKSQTVVPGGQP